MSPTKTVIRIEDKDTGFGCFTSLAVARINESSVANYKRPMPVYTKKTRRFVDKRFAFSSRTQMFSWFTKRQIKKLLQENCHVLAITVPKKAVARLNKQVVYDPNHVLDITPVDITS